MRHALVTGGAGFIGSHLVDRLLADGWRVTCVDDFDPFYDRALKESNIQVACDCRGYRLVEEDIRNLSGMRARLREDYDVVFHLAAKAGVRPSIEDPITYQQVDLGGTQNILEFAKERGIKEVIFASSSSVYGTNPSVPWHEDTANLLPISPYAASKVAAELLGHVYTHLYGIRFIALRFFTVYGPRQRPDLAISKFTRLMLEGRPIPVFGDGSSSRDYTYVDDIIDGVIRASRFTGTDYEIINLGNTHAVELRELIGTLETVLGKPALIQREPTQPGDVPRTWADCTRARDLLGYAPKMKLADGLALFHQWYAARLSSEA
jgi:UDP-glucuronate 4-epimerase